MKQYSSLIERRDETRGKSITFVPVGGLGMGQLAFIKMFLLVSIPTDINDNRRHVHVFRKGRRHLTSVAKICIESNGSKCIEIAYSELSTKENAMLLSAIDTHWEYIDMQITRTFKGEKTVIKDLGK